MSYERPLACPQSRGQTQPETDRVVDPSLFCQVSARIRQCTRSILRRLFSKTVWAGPVTNGCRVGHEAHTLTPIMQLVTRRLQGEPQRCLRAEIEHELMGCARGG